MAEATLILVVLPLITIADASQLMFGKIEGKIYAETDSDHFAMFGQVTDRDGIRVIAVDHQGQFHLTSKCESGWKDTKKLDKSVLQSYAQIRDVYMQEKRDPSESPRSYTWSDTLSSDQKGFAAVRLDPDTIAYSSQYFPEGLARVIISGNVVTFVHYDGKVRIKTTKCLYLNERILVEGIRKLDPDWKKSLFSSKGDKVLKKHLKYQGFDTSPYGSFDSEQDFSKTRTPQELAAMQNAVLGGGMRAFDGWGP